MRDNLEISDKLITGSGAAIGGATGGLALVGWQKSRFHDMGIRLVGYGRVWRSIKSFREDAITVVKVKPLREVADKYEEMIRMASCKIAELGFCRLTGIIGGRPNRNGEELTAGVTNCNILIVCPIDPGVRQDFGGLRMIMALVEDTTKMLIVNVF